MHEGTTFIGLDVHKRSIVVAVRQPGSGTVVEERLPHETAAVKRWARAGRDR